MTHTIITTEEILMIPRLRKIEPQSQQWKFLCQKALDTETCQGMKIRDCRIIHFYELTSSFQLVIFCIVKAKIQITELDTQNQDIIIFRLFIINADPQQKTC